MPCRFFHLDPEQAGLTRATRISLKGNPSQNEAWTVSLNESEPQPATFADWLFTLSAWQEHFWKLPENDSQACSLHEYLELDAKAQEGKTAVIYRSDENGEATTLAVSNQVIDASREALAAWNYLREIAGALSPHPQKLWEEAEASLSVGYESKLQEMELAHENRIKNLEQEFLEKTRVQLREKLLTLARNRSQKV